MNETGRGISPALVPRFAALMRLLAAGLFAGIVATAAAAGAASHSQYTPWPLTAGRVAATVALALFMVQFALSARVGWLDKAFGLDRLYRIHAKVGTAAAVLAVPKPTYAVAPPTVAAPEMENRLFCTVRFVSGSAADDAMYTPAAAYG